MILSRKPASILRTSEAGFAGHLMKSRDQVAFLAGNPHPQRGRGMLAISVVFSQLEVCVSDIHRRSVDCGLPPQQKRAVCEIPQSWNMEIIKESACTTPPNQTPMPRNILYCQGRPS